MPPAPTSIARLMIEPPEAVLVGPRARQGLLVAAVDARGARRDVTGSARFVSLDPRVARVTPAGIVVPVGDGTVTLKAAAGERVAFTAVRVRQCGGSPAARPARPISFTNEVVPLLTRAGCNQGACHGAQYGKGGFKLSLAGYDPALDYEAMTRQGGARRLCRAQPGRSLILLKPTASISHGGGQRFAAGSPAYRLLEQWIVDGAPGPQPADPQIVALEIYPKSRVMTPRERQRLVVQARFSDGAACDVTAQTRLNTLNDGVAAVTPDGEVTATAPGQTGIMARYMGLAAVAGVVVPFSSSRLNAHQGGNGLIETAKARNHESAKGEQPDAGLPSRFRTFALSRSQSNVSSFSLGGERQTGSFVDELVARKWEALGLEPSGTCTDAEFIRRASLDVIGTLPAPEEVRAFLASREPDKRARLIDSLLARPEYADYWSLKWGDLLRVSRSRLDEKGMWSFYTWLHSVLSENRPVDRWVRELITAQGSTYTTGPANFYRVASSPSDLAETTSQVFLGVRLQCARCHHHPFEQWSQDDYYSLAAYFARVGLKGSDEFGIFGGEQVVRLRATGEVHHPKTNAEMRPRPLDAVRTVAGRRSDDDPVDRRRALAAWLTAKSNLPFARNIANRYWAYLMGRGIVEPVDDMRVTNPPTNPELLDALARDFVAKGFDLKALLRTIMTSRVYGLSSTATPANRADEMFFSHFLVRRLPAETLLDALSAATGTVEKFPGLPRGTRAIQLPDARVDSFFLDTFGRPPREIACECERSAEPNIAQALQLMNGDLLNGKIGRDEGRVARLVAARKPTAEIIRELYLAALSRPPRPTELATALRMVGKAPALKEGVEDLLWTLLNSREFLFDH